MTAHLWLAFSGCVALLGACVLARERCRPRQGQTRRCRRCRYDLTGNASGRCPECGADLSRRRSVRVGERTMRRWRVALGIVLLLLAAAVPTSRTVAWARSKDWYPYYPALWVLHDMHSAQPPVRDKALVELVGRYEAGRLSQSQINEMGEGAFMLCARVRPRMVVGQRYQVAFWCEARVPYFGLTPLLEPQVVRLGETELAAPPPGFWVALDVLPQVAGAQELQVEARLHWGDATTRRHVSTLRTAVSVEVVSADACEQVRVVESSEIDKLIRQRVDVLLIDTHTTMPQEFKSPPPLQTMLAVRNEGAVQPAPPIAIAAGQELPAELFLRAFAAIDEGLLEIGAVRITKYGRVEWLEQRALEPLRAAVAGSARREFDVRLKSDRTLALGEPDVQEIWGGELVVEDVPVVLR